MNLIYEDGFNNVRKFTEELNSKAPFFNNIMQLYPIYGFPTTLTIGSAKVIQRCDI